MNEQKTPRVSILIPVWNGEDSIDRSLASATSQSLAEIEIIVIDDDSKDGTVKQVQDWAARDPRIRLMRASTNGGPGAARTLGLQHAHGEWIAVFDADDTMQENRLEKLLAEAESDDLDAIADNLALVDPGLQEIVGNAFPMQPEDKVNLTAERFLDNARPGAKINMGWIKPVVRRSFLLQQGIDWPALRHAEDMVFTMRILMAGGQFRVIGHPYYQYTQRRGTISGKRSNASRTQRSTDQQLLSLKTISEAPQATAFSRMARKRLSRMPSEVQATTHALDLQDALHDGKIGSALSILPGLIGNTPALFRVLWIRYVRGRKLI